MIAPFLERSIVGRAVQKGLVVLRFHNLFDAVDPGERPDDRPFGGGPGMVLRIEPIARLLDAILSEAPAGERRAIVVTSPAGSTFRQSDARRLASLDRLVIVCGHYEGIDERLVALYGAEELSLGEFVLTGGEIAAAAFADATVRLVPGVINAESLMSESFAEEGVDHPAYTRPREFRGLEVPEVLLSGDHARIAGWRKEEAERRTKLRQRK